MKRTDLEKLKGMKISNRLKGTPPPARFGTGPGGGQAAAQINPLVAKLLARQENGESAGDETPRE